MTEKDNVSMATVQLKPDYAASEVYSTASEPPPAYKRQANSVKIAKIAAFTIIASSFILGSFLLALSYVQARASCDQVQALDSVLEKELMLETLQQVNKELPRAEALLGKSEAGEDLQNLDHDETLAEKKTVSKNEDVNDHDNSYSDSDETEEMQKFPGKMPLELDLSDLAAAILRNNKKSRMNCVVERKHAEEIVDSPSKTVALPFGVNLTTDPKKARITGERISIFCDGGEDKEEKEAKRQREEEDDSEEDTESMHPMFIPLQRVPMPFGRIPDQMPLTHMPQRMMPPAMQQQLPQQGHPSIILRQLPPPFQHLPMRPPMPPQVMQAPRMEEQPHQPQIQTVRIHMHQLPFRPTFDMPNDIPRPAQHQPEMPQRDMPPRELLQREMAQREMAQREMAQREMAQREMAQREMGQREMAPREMAPRDMPQIQIQHMPLGMALESVGITADDLRNIQRMAMNSFAGQMHRFTAGEGADSNENNSANSSEEEEQHSETAMPSGEQSTTTETQSSNQQQQREQQPVQQPEQPQQQRDQESSEQQQEEQLPHMQIQRLILQPLPEQPRDTMTPPMPDQSAQAVPVNRMFFGRSLAQPVRIPVPMMQPAEGGAVSEESQRPHFVQPRSV
ncbi:putative uncharacterized protein DDB_G0271606 isoform X2 [Drosophila grimshawi]|uniref:putative uncharacterized protein DDB_G0271606 isoform X2 n=1 Tax=Drosophila grimshawi TaxID=7222 RepID=UPI000C871621|nr:putative uncharacterized protein DDB_G0271606 isoform X2 [Drosophila grimshawi]